MLGKVVREGVSVYLPYVNTHSSVDFRTVMVNRMDEPVPYNFEFNAPDGISAVGGAEAEGILPESSLSVLKARKVVTVTGSRTYTTASLTVSASPEMIDITTFKRTKATAARIRCGISRRNNRKRSDQPADWRGPMRAAFFV